MATPERLRMLVFNLARDTWGDEGAEALMELLPPPTWSEVARQSDVAALAAELRGEIAELRGEMRAQLWKHVLVSFSMMVGLSGTLIGAAHFV